MKIKEETCFESIKGDYLHYCPGCKQMHLINTLRKNHNGAQWSFDGNFENPTFNPSINILPFTNSNGNQQGGCHYFIHSGIIEYCSDSMHKFAGQKIELPEIPDYYL